MKKFDPSVQGTPEQVEKAMACQSAEELQKLATEEGFDMTDDFFPPTLGCGLDFCRIWQ